MGRHRKKKGRPVSGWLVLDKPKGMGSTEAVAKIKWLYQAEKAGHAGTLDPLASGLLPIALGEATKTVPYVMEGAKTYIFTVAWGEERTTDDREGDVTKTSERRPQRRAIEAVLPQFTGVLVQTPPQFSAIKIDGNRAYDLARDGQAVLIPPREVEVDRLEIIDASDVNHTVFKVDCGKGTYVRALARDIGRALGCFGYVVELRRTNVAPFDEKDMIPLSELLAADPKASDSYDKMTEGNYEALDSYLIETAAALESLSSFDLSEQQAIRVKMGNPVLLLGKNIIMDDEACAYHNGALLAIGVVEKGHFKPRRVFSC